jgi:hypothetical protein
MLPGAEKRHGVTRHLTVWAGAGWMWLMMGLLVADWYLRRSRGLR